MKDKYNLLVGGLFYLLILFLFFTSILYSYFVINMDFISNGIILFGILSFLLYISYSVKNKVFKIWNLLVLIIIFLLYLSYYNAFDKFVALRGFYNGREGIFVIISYYFLFLLSTTIDNTKVKENIFNLLIMIGVVNIIYGIFQVFDIEYIFSIPVARNWSAASGFLFNPDFLSSYVILIFGYLLVKYFFNDGVFNLNYLLLVIFIFGIFLTGTMMAYLTMLVLSLAMGIILILKKKVVFKKILMYIGAILISFLIVGFGTSSNIKSDISNLNQEIGSTIKGDIEDSFGTGRIYIWKEALKYFPNYIWTGIGIDNFAYLGFNDYTFIYDSSLQDNVVYKAHSEYIQILVCEGLFTFITYLIFIFLVISRGIFVFRKNKDILYLGFIFSLIGYLIQALFNIRLTLVAPIFFVIMGFVVNTWKADIEN